MTSLSSRPLRFSHTPPEVSRRNLLVLFWYAVVHNDNKSSYPMKIVPLWRPDGGHVYYLRNEIFIFLVTDSCYFLLRAADGAMHAMKGKKELKFSFKRNHGSPSVPTTMLIWFLVDWTLNSLTVNLWLYHIFRWKLVRFYMCWSMKMVCRLRRKHCLKLIMRQ